MVAAYPERKTKSIIASTIAVAILCLRDFFFIGYDITLVNGGMVLPFGRCRFNDKPKNYKK